MPPPSEAHVRVPMSLESFEASGNFEMLHFDSVHYVQKYGVDMTTFHSRY